MNIVKLCGEMPIEVIGNYKGGYNVKDYEKLSPSSAAGLTSMKRVIRGLESFGFDMSPGEEFHGGGLEFQKDEIRLFPDKLMRMWGFRDYPSLLTKYFRDFTREDTDGTHTVFHIIIQWLAFDGNLNAHFLSNK